MSYYFSPSKNIFYFGDSKDSYVKTRMWADDSEVIDDKVVKEFTSLPPAGKMRGVVDGAPAWVDKPAPTHEQLVAHAAAKQKQLIVEANEYIGLKQWSGKAALGRLSDDEKAQYSAWLDYLDELEAVNPADAPDKWPSPPEEKAI